jgi:hypothetical protein
MVEREIIERRDLSPVATDSRDRQLMTAADVAVVMVKLAAGAGLAFAVLWLVD